MEYSTHDIVEPVLLDQHQVRICAIPPHERVNYQCIADNHAGDWASSCVLEDFLEEIMDPVYLENLAEIQRSHKSDTVMNEVLSEIGWTYRIVGVIKLMKEIYYNDITKAAGYTGGLGGEQQIILWGDTLAFYIMSWVSDV